MNDIPATPPPGTPPPLMGRAPRPPAIRIRKPVVQAIALGAAGLLAGALAWAFVIQPDLRARSLGHRPDPAADERRGPVRPPDALIDQPASYDRLPDRLARPEPAASVEPQAAAPTRSPGGGGPEPAHPRESRERSSTIAQAESSALFFAATSRPAGIPDGGGLPTAGAAPAAGETREPSPYRLSAGTVVPAVLLTGIVTSRPGPVAAAVSQNVFDSFTGRRLLVPQGSRLIGRHEGESAHGDRRAFLVWERLILPNGRVVALDDVPGVDALGRVGVEGRADRRLVDLGIAALTSGLMTTVAEYARGGADDEDRGSFVGHAGDAASLEAARLGGRLIDRELQVRPVIRVDPGAPVRAMVTRDLFLEPYQP